MAAVSAGLPENSAVMISAKSTLGRLAGTVGALDANATALHPHA